MPAFFSCSSLYSRSMSCGELERLRADARRIYKQLSEKVRRSQDFSVAEGHSGRTDYQAFLKHQLVQAEAEIRRHLEEHKCSREAETG